MSLSFECEWLRVFRDLAEDGGLGGQFTIVRAGFTKIAGGEWEGTRIFVVGLFGFVLTVSGKRAP